MKNDSSGGVIDLTTPIIEIINELLNLIFKVLSSLIGTVINKIFKSKEIKSIPRSALKFKKVTETEDSLGISALSKRDIPLGSIDFSKHSFIVGASGFGKTNLISILQENSLKKGKALLFFDPKGDLEALLTFKNLCQEQGKTCYIFSEHYSDSIKLNPILEGSINQVADRVMRSFEWSETFYRDVSHRTLIQVLKDLKVRDKDFTLLNIHELLSNKYGSDKIIGLLVKLESLLESDFGNLLNGGRDDLTFSKIRKEGASLYIGLSTQGYGETAMAIGRLFLGELLYNSYTSLNSYEGLALAKKRPLSIYFDEFGSIVTPQFIELQNKCRGAGIELTMAVQSGADIDRISPDLTKQIVENSSNIFILKQRLDASASFFSEAIGTTISKKKTFVTEDGDIQSKGTIREANELLVHPDIIKNLRVGQCVLLEHNPTKIDLLNIRLRKEERHKKTDKMKKIKTILKINGGQ